MTDIGNKGEPTDRKLTQEEIDVLVQKLLEEKEKKKAEESKDREREE